MTDTELHILRAVLEGRTDLASLAQAAGLPIEALAELPADSPLYAAMENIGRLCDATARLTLRSFRPDAASHLLRLSSGENPTAAVRACQQLLTDPDPKAPRQAAVQFTILQDAPVLADFAERYRKRIEAHAQPET